MRCFFVAFGCLIKNAPNDKVANLLVSNKFGEDLNVTFGSVLYEKLGHDVLFNPIYIIKRKFLYIIFYLTSLTRDVSTCSWDLASATTAVFPWFASPVFSPSSIFSSIIFSWFAGADFSSLS